MVQGIVQGQDNPFFIPLLIHLGCPFYPTRSFFYANPRSAGGKGWDPASRRGIVHAGWTKVKWKGLADLSGIIKKSGCLCY